MENCSFDHMLGYLNLPPWNAGRPAVDGVSLDPAWVRRFTNFYDSRSFARHDFTDRLIDDRRTHGQQSPCSSVQASAPKDP
jgi:hypothetical protein